MKTLPRLAAAALLLSLLPAAFAKDQNGLRIEVRKTTLERNDDTRPGWDSRMDRTLGLKLIAKNTSFKETPEGVIEWTIIVQRWGSSTRRYERYQGVDKLPPLRPGEEVNLTVGESKLTGYREYDGRYQDKIEGWSLTIKHAGAITISDTSGSNFDRLNASAKDATSSD